MATSNNISIDQGAYWSQEILWETGTPAAPVDLTGYTARMQIRKRVRSADPLIELLEGTGPARITLGGTAGTILLEIDADATADLPATPTDHRWYYDLELVPAGGQVRRLLQGRAIVSPEVTRD